MRKNKWGLPDYVDESKLVPHPTQVNHYIFPNETGNASLDEVFNLHPDFTAQRSADDDEVALQKYMEMRSLSAQDQAEALIEAAKKQAEEIIANAQSQANAMKSSIPTKEMKTKEELRAEAERAAKAAATNNIPPPPSGPVGGRDNSSTSSAVPPPAQT